MSYRPWVEQAKGGAFLLIIGMILWWLGLVLQNFPLIALGFLSDLVGIILLNRALVRWTGQRVERIAFNRLTLPDGWTSVANVPVPGLGDADILVTSPTGLRFVIEIKSFRDVVRKKTLISEQLVDSKGYSLKRDPVGQVLKLAERLNAKPILFFPRSKLKGDFVMRNGVAVACGNHKFLKRALGLGRMFSIW